MPCNTGLLGYSARKYRWQQSSGPMTSPNVTFDAGQVKVGSNFEINIFAQKAHVSSSEFSQDSKYAISLLVRCGKRRKIASQKMESSIFRCILQIPFFIRNIGFVCGNCILIQSNHKVVQTPFSHQDESNDMQLDSFDVFDIGLRSMSKTSVKFALA